MRYDYYDYQPPIGMANPEVLSHSFQAYDYERYEEEGSWQEKIFTTK